MALFPYPLILLVIQASLQLNGKKVPFNVHNPEIKIEISAELKEISGLSWYGHNQLAAIQDEAGIVYLLNANTGQIDDKIRFSLPGDFEGIERVNNTLYALTSSGTLFSFPIDDSRQVTRHDTPLSWRNDAEGLAYDEKNHCLLIVCKEDGGIKDTEIKGKAIYGFNLTTHKLTDKPLAVIKKKSLEKYQEIDKFKPSALAIDPLTRDIYLLAAVGNWLVVLSADYQLKDVIKLPKDSYPQPEGLCFSPDGDMYISNEGKKGPATIYHLLRNR